jgi:hypothetical protein
MSRHHEQLLHSLVLALLDNPFLVHVPRVVQAHVGLPGLHGLLALSRGYAKDMATVLMASPSASASWSLSL